MTNEIERRVAALLKTLEGGNPFGEKITLVAATKTRTAEEINRAICAGITDVGENRVQEFCLKYGDVHGGRRHFIGHLQLNKVKYLVGKVCLFQSVDRDGLAAEIARLSLRAGLVSDILIQINIGREATKGGYLPAEGMDAFRRLAATEGLRVKGFMAMLPRAGEDELLPLCDGMRALYERAKEVSPDVEFLSMGMSGDFPLCISRGANMIRLGTAVFGERT